MERAAATAAAAAPVGRVKRDHHHDDGGGRGRAVEATKAKVLLPLDFGCK